MLILKTNGLSEVSHLSYTLQQVDQTVAFNVK